MSLFGALRTGVSGLTAQSSAMGIISDNIANVNTIGYKANSASFSTLVTKQTSSTRYTSGGVQCRTRAGVDVQGLLSSTSYSTDLGISGSGFFVTTQTSQPDADDLWSYTRVGSFSVDQDGYLKNDNGFYLQAWPLQAYDGYENASLVQIGDNMYMKAYTNDAGTTVYVNDNIIDSTNLRAVNLNTIGGTAQETHNISFGANLPADAPVFDAGAPEKGGRYSSSVLVYDSLGNSHNATLTFTKTETGTWSLDIGMPSGAATLVTYSSSEVTNDASQDVYSARAQLEFTAIPTNHSTVSIETNGTNYVFEFTTDGTTTYSPAGNEVVVAVDLSAGIVTTGDAVAKFNEVIQATLPSAGRFSVGSDGTTIEVNQSNSGAALKFKVGTTACLQSAANPDPTTGISTGEFELPELDWDIKNTARIDFSSNTLTDYLGKSVTIGSNTYVFRDVDAATSNGVVTVNISSLIDYSTGKIDTVKLVSLLKQSINNNEPDYDRYVASGSTLEINPTSTGSNILVSSGNAASVTFQTTNIAAYVGQTVTIGDIAGGGSKTYKFSNNSGIPSGTTLSDGSIAVNISDLSDKDGTSAAPIAVMNALYNTMKSYYESANGVEDLSNYIQVSGATMVSAGDYLSAASSTATLNQDTLTFTSTDITDYDGTSVTINGTTYTLARGTSNSTTLDLDTLINTEELTFSAVPSAGDTVVVNGTTYTFVSGSAGTNEIDISSFTTADEAMAALGSAAGISSSVSGATLTLSGDNISIGTCSVASLMVYVNPTEVMTALAALAGVSDYQSGASLVMTAFNTNAISTGDYSVTTTTTTEPLKTFGTTTGIGSALDIVGKDNGKQLNQPDTDGLLVLTNTFSFNNVAGAQSGSIIPAVSFNADGTPKQINTDKVAIEWANGASDMTGNYYESSQVNLYIGDANTANGLTQLAGKFATNYVNQDGAKYGSYTGVSISESGIVTAIFDNGETRAIAQIPLATFVDVNSLEMLSGNAYIETTSSGNATLRTAGEGGAGVISSSSLEESTVDIAEEFTDMITTQRAYSAASKIITTADSMLEELISIKR
ncbi:MAG: flagellar hook-basal body complex protein [Alphaproteobacteria bacterium]|nr:flagellar hook-basal body complex protein [Alphaproteobacteria bacterium]